MFPTLPEPVREPAELRRRFIDAINAHDIGALMALYEPRALGLDLDGRWLENRQALRAFLAGFLQVAQRIEGETRRLYVAGDLALMSSDWRALLTGPGGETTEVEATSAEVARRDPDGHWHFVIDAPVFGSAMVAARAR